ncbi:MAG TPA: protein-L-isoaspartate(D-aspartate) O-methyltransferase [Chloroflexi bacterium]|nr:protein-L-isoaspartate(D-aspartate) O-methyltransferase [Chloroflexota bacterium]
MDFEKERDQMVNEQLIPMGIKEAAVLEAMRTVPREQFVAAGDEDLAYMDGPLGIGQGQTISQPYIVALMAELLELTPEKSVLEVGTGSGYAAAVLSLIAKDVYTVERHASLAKQAETRFQSLGYDNIHVKIGDGTLGWEQYAPYDAILLSAAARHVPQALKAQVSIGGVMVLPLGIGKTEQWLVKITKTEADTYATRHVCPVRFVPIIGKDGWRES